MEVSALSHEAFGPRQKPIDESRLRAGVGTLHVTSMVAPAIRRPKIRFAFRAAALEKLGAATLVRHTSDLLSELTRAANNQDKRNNHQRKRLVEEAISAIEQLRDRARVTAKLSASDPAFKLQFISAAITIGWATDSRVKIALLAAASEIRELSVVLGAGAEVKDSEDEYQ